MDRSKHGKYLHAMAASNQGGMRVEAHRVYGNQTLPSKGLWRLLELLDLFDQFSCPSSLDFRFYRCKA